MIDRGNTSCRRCASTLLRFVLLLLGLAALHGCVSFAPDPEWRGPAFEKAQSETRNNIMVSAIVLQDDEAERAFGVDLSSRQIRAIWLEVRNETDEMLHLMPSSLDPDYFSQNEAAYRFHSSFKSKQNGEIAEHFHSLAIRKDVNPGQTNSGYVLVNRHRGGRFLIVELTSDETLHRFDFMFTLPDGTFDFEVIDFDTLYPSAEQRELELGQLKSWAAALPCCTTNEDGDKNGDPLNVVFVGELNDLMGALARSGWTYTERITGTSVWEAGKSALFGSPGWNFPISPLYTLGRHQDFAMQRPRGTIPQRNHMRFWMAPVRHQGKHVWLAQISRDVGVKPTWHSPFLFTHTIDPEIDEDRSYLLESLIRSQSVAAYGYVEGVGKATADNPSFNLTKDPYRTDGRRLLVIIAGEDPVPISDVAHLP